MRSLLAVDRSGLNDSVEEAIDLYEVRCRTGEVSLTDFWENLGTPDSPSLLAILVKIDLERRFQLGERPRAAEYLEKFPILTESSEQVVSLVYEEFCLLQESDANPDSEEFCDAYGPWRDSLRSQLLYHRELSRAIGVESRPVKFPLPGELFEKYRLQSVLGRGGVARVYLATEDDLGGRKLAIKISHSFGQEPAILAKLDHRNIVPILTVARSESGLRGICMPYRSGVTLEELIRRIGRGAPPRTARAIWDSLTPTDLGEDSLADELRTGWAGFPIDRTFSEAVAWIGLAMTNALSYLHGQGVFHRDIKPANVLLAYREGPQLLDFNLAQDPSAPEHVNAALKGGTLPYMAPEQLKAFLDPAGWEKVGPAADLYSLGLVLKELVTGQPPDVPSTASSIPRGIATLLERRMGLQPSIREINPSVPPTFISIIEKCLAVDPLDRYENASDLAEDLQCFLARKPLAHAPNPSKIERAVNWFYRNQQGLDVTVALLAGLAVMFGVSRLLSPAVIPGPALIPRPAAIPVPPVIPISIQVQKHEYLLDSNRREDWKRAQVIFADLQTKFPDSAWPRLYLCLVLEKLGGMQNKKQAQEFIQVACQKDGAEEALARRLEKDPKSPKLMTNLGLVHFGKGDFTKSRNVLLKSLQLDKNEFRTLATLAEAERKTGEFHDAIEHFSRAVKIGKASTFISPYNIHQLHKGMLWAYLGLFNKSIDGQPGERARAPVYLSQWQSILGGFNEDWKNAGAWKSLDDRAKARENYDWTIQFFEGCIASGQAVLAADQPDRDRASQLFQAAERRFSSARDMLKNRVGDNKKSLREVEEEVEILQARLRKYNINPNVGHVVPNRVP